MRVLSSVVSLCFVAPLFASAEASACVGLPCTDPWVLSTSDGGTLPASAPVIVLKPSFSGVGFTPYSVQDAGIELLRADGSPVAIEVSAPAGDRVFVTPKQPLPSGESLRLRYPMFCRLSQSQASGGPSSTMTYEAAFATTAEPLPPTNAAQITLADQSWGPFEVHQSVQCGALIDAAFARFTLEPSRAFAAFWPVTEWVLEVDGAVWARETFGMVRADGSLAELPRMSQYLTGRRILAVHAACAPTADGQDDEGLALGEHTALWRATIAGRTPQVVATASFALSCADRDGGASFIPDGGPVDAGPSVPPPTDKCAVSPEPTHSAEGCTSVASSPMLLVALVAMLGLARRSRAKAC